MYKYPTGCSTSKGLESILFIPNTRLHHESYVENLTLTIESATQVLVEANFSNHEHLVTREGNNLFIDTAIPMTSIVRYLGPCWLIVSLPTRTGRVMSRKVKVHFQYPLPASTLKVARITSITSALVFIESHPHAFDSFSPQSLLLRAWNVTAAVSSERILFKETDDIFKMMNLDARVHDIPALFFKFKELEGVDEVVGRVSTLKIVEISIVFIVPCGVQ